MSGVDPLLAFGLGVLVTLVVGYLWSRWRWSAGSRVGGPPPPGSLVDAPGPAPAGKGSGPERRGKPGPGAASASELSGDNALRLSERVLLHLDRFDRSNSQELASFLICQQGMVERLGVRQGALAKVLHRLIVAGAIVESTEHVQGRSHRRKVYRLTTLGRLLAKDLRARARRPSPPPSTA